MNFSSFGISNIFLFWHIACNELLQGSKLIFAGELVLIDSRRKFFLQERFIVVSMIRFIIFSKTI